MEGLRVRIQSFPQNKKKGRKITEKYLEEELQIGTIEQVCVRSQKKDKYQIHFIISNWDEKSKYSRTVKYVLMNGNKFRLLLNGVSCYIEPTLQIKTSSKRQKRNKKSAERKISAFRDEKWYNQYHNYSPDMETELFREQELQIQYLNELKSWRHYYECHLNHDYDDFEYYQDVDPNRVDEYGYLSYY